jgi:hypothetical protein
VTKTTIMGAAAAIVVMATAAIAVEHFDGQATSAIAGDFRDAMTAEVRDAQGQTLLRGTFAVIDGDDKGEVERHAKLTPLTPGTGAAGEAEVEYQVENPAQQEIELSATGLQPGGRFSLVIDGGTVATATANSKGEVEVEVNTR